MLSLKKDTYSIEFVRLLRQLLLLLFFSDVISQLVLQPPLQDKLAIRVVLRLGFQKGVGICDSKLNFTVQLADSYPSKIQRCSVSSRRCHHVTPKDIPRLGQVGLATSQRPRESVPRLAHGDPRPPPQPELRGLRGSRGPVPGEVSRAALPTGAGRI